MRRVIHCAFEDVGRFDVVLNNAGLLHLFALRKKTRRLRIKWD